ncbi:hypothetical protein V2J09_019366 [Rumex salicifolius]
MAAGANPSDSPAFNGVSAALAAGATVNGNLDNSGMVHIPSPGISTDWTAEEQIALEEGIAKYSGIPSVVRYAKIAMTMPNKTVRDVALRCRHMNKKEISKRRKEEPSRKSKDKREKVTETSSKQSHIPSQPDNHPYSVLPVSISDNDDGVSYKALGGPTGELLELNIQILQKISANFSSCQFQENENLLCQARNNITKMMNSLNETPEILKQLPPFPMKMNEELTKREFVDLQRVASPVLSSLLLQSKPKNGKLHLKLPDAPHGAVYAFIRFLYSSCYEEDDMKKVCVEFMEQQWLTTENVIDVLQLARNCDAPRLSLICVHMIIKNFKSVSSSDGWRAMRRSNPSLEQELLESAVDSDSRKQERLVREEKMVYVQLHEAMEALLHFCKDGCRSNKISQIKCKRSACKSIEIDEFEADVCTASGYGNSLNCTLGCVIALKSARFLFVGKFVKAWEFLNQLNLVLLNVSMKCSELFKQKVRRLNKKDEAKWRLLVKKVIEAKSVENPLYKSKLKLISL